MADVPLSPPRRVTAADVAQLAGCSQAAVSLWVTGKYEGRLAPEWQKRIADAIQELGYVPNRAARRLVNRVMPSASFIFPGASYAFFGPVLNGVIEALGTEWDILMFDSRPGRIEEHGPGLVSSAISGDTTGVILASPTADDLVHVARTTATSVVVVDSPEAPDHASRVAFDMRSAVGAAVDHLVELGHQSVGYVSYTGRGLSLTYRRDLLMSALRGRGVRTPVPDLETSSFEVEATARELKRMWGAWREAGVTAVVCCDERQAYGVLAAAREIGLHLPGDLSLISFRDSVVAPLLTPSLSSIRLPALELGASAGRALTRLVAGDPPGTTLIEADYIARGSTAPPPR